MSKTFHIPLRQRLFNAFLRTLGRAGVAIGPFYLLTVEGRKTGKSYTVPVTPLEHGDTLFLVSPFGEVDWVRNTRAVRVVTLSRGHSHRRLALHELSPLESAPVLKDYLNRFLRHVRSSFEISPQSELEAFVAEAPRHPVFQAKELPRR